MFVSEIEKASFDICELSYLIHGNKQKYQNFIKAQELVANDPILQFNPANLYRSREDIINHCAKKLIRYTQVFPQNQTTQDNKLYFFEQQIPLKLHDYMFLTTLRNLCDEQQLKELLQSAERGEIIGCYAQTQLAHGSDVQGIMTEAIYDKATQSFIINTPSIKAAKWWIGELGVFCTHACVFAQLIIEGKKHGIHAFVVPIRDKSHQPFPGIEVGDVGPKLGSNAKDNGYLIFSNYKIPRKMMLMRYSKVSKQGHYSKEGDDKITYATMLKIRAGSPLTCFAKIAMASTIITRYSYTRRQFKDQFGNQISILDYQLQQEKIFPRIAEAFAYLFAAKTNTQRSELILSEAKNNKFDKLNQAHVVSSALKAIATKDATKGLQILRRSAGGHGYSCFSGLPSLQLQISSSYTYEGQYTILLLQVARFLIKSLNNSLKGENLDQSVRFFENSSKKIQILNTQGKQVLMNPLTIVKLFQQHTYQRAKKANQKMKQGISVKGLQTKKAWDQYAGLELVQAGAAFSYQWVAQNYLKRISAQSLPESVKKVLLKLFALYSIDKILENATSFYEMGVLGSSSLKTYRNIKLELLRQIRPDALAICESFGFGDNVLCSALAYSDGKVYQHLLDWARNYNDINRADVRDVVRQEALILMNKMRQLTKPKL